MKRCESIFNKIDVHLADRGLFLREGTIIDATLIAVPLPTRNTVQMFSLFGFANLLLARR